MRLRDDKKERWKYQDVTANKGLACSIECEFDRSVRLDRNRPGRKGSRRRKLLTGTPVSRRLIINKYLSDTSEIISDYRTRDVVCLESGARQRHARLTFKCTLHVIFTRRWKRRNMTRNRQQIFPLRPFATLGRRILRNKLYRRYDIWSHCITVIRMYIKRTYTDVLI